MVAWSHVPVQNPLEEVVCDGGGTEGGVCDGGSVDNGKQRKGRGNEDQVIPVKSPTSFREATPLQAQSLPENPPVAGDQESHM